MRPSPQRVTTVTQSKAPSGLPKFSKPVQPLGIKTAPEIDGISSKLYRSNRLESLY